MPTPRINVYALIDPSVKKRHIPLLNPNLGTKKKERKLFMGEEYSSAKPLFELMPAPERAEFLLVPYTYFDIAHAHTYLNHYVALAERFEKKILVFDFSDCDKEIPIPHALVFRYSQYRYKKKANEYIIPPFIEDLGAQYGIGYREKGALPVVGFTGWADFQNPLERMRYAAKNILRDIESLWNPYAPVHKQGLYFRRRAVRALQSANLITPNFIVRKSYSGHADTIELDIRRARDEYVKNIKTSDFVLTPKGDGNYSMRFYETLALGRIPLLIDTETILPLEKKIPYREFTFAVSWRDIAKIQKLLFDFYQTLSQSGFAAMQEKARSAFANFLNAETFYEKLFAELREKERRAGT